MPWTEAKVQNLARVGQTKKGSGSQKTFIQDAYTASRSKVWEVTGKGAKWVPETGAQDMGKV